MNFLVDAMENICSDTEGLGTVISLLKNVVKLIQWGVPILLIIFGMLDLGKAVMAGKEDDMKKFQGALIKRFLYAIAVFLVVSLVTFAMGLVGSDEWRNCWNNTGNTTVNNSVEG